MVGLQRSGVGSVTETNYFHCHSSQHRKSGLYFTLKMLADDMIVYMENPIDSTKKLLDLINEFGKRARYKVNTQKSKAFLYTNNETAETEIKEQNPI